MTPPIGRPYQKNYEIAGNRFTVQVAYQGDIPMGHLAQIMGTWFFNLVVNNVVVEMGFWRDLRDQRPSNDDVCDSLAQFWHDSEKIKQAQILGEDENKAALEEIVKKCAKRMFYYFMRNEEPFDYEILHQHMDEIGWDVILTPNINLPGRKQMILHFSQMQSHDGVWVRSYELEHSAYINENRF